MQSISHLFSNILGTTQLDGSNFSLWKRLLESILVGCGPTGIAIKTRTPIVLPPFPTFETYIKDQYGNDTTTLRYPRQLIPGLSTIPVIEGEASTAAQSTRSHTAAAATTVVPILTATNSEPTPAAVLRLQTDIDAHKALMEKLLNNDGLLCVLIWSSVTLPTQISVSTYAGVEVLQSIRDKAQVVELYMAICDSQSSHNSYQTRTSLLKLINAKQGDDVQYDQVHTWYADLASTVHCNLEDPKHPGYIELRLFKINNYLDFLNNMFAPHVERTKESLKLRPTVSLQVIMEETMNYYLLHRSDFEKPKMTRQPPKGIRPPGAAPASDTTKSLPQPLPAKACTTCSAMFIPAKPAYKYCSKCLPALPPRTPAPTQLLTVPTVPAITWENGEDWSANMCYADHPSSNSPSHTSSLPNPIDSENESALEPTTSQGTPTSTMSESDNSSIHHHNIYLCDDTDEDWHHRRPVYLPTNERIPPGCQLGNENNTWLDTVSSAAFLNSRRSPHGCAFSPHSHNYTSRLMLAKSYLSQEFLILDKQTMNPLYDCDRQGYVTSDRLFYLTAAEDLLYDASLTNNVRCHRLHCCIFPEVFIYVPEWGSKYVKHRKMYIEDIIHNITNWCDTTPTVPFLPTDNATGNPWIHYISHWFLRAAIQVDQHTIYDCHSNNIVVSLSQIYKHLFQTSCSESDLMVLTTAIGAYSTNSNFSLQDCHPMLEQTLIGDTLVVTSKAASNMNTFVYSPSICLTAPSNSISSLISKQALPSSRRPIYWDNGSSLNVTPDINSLSEFSPINPFPLGGVGSGVLVTAVGKHKGLPLGLDKCYYAEQATATLFSVGYLCSLNCHTTQDKHFFKIYDKNNVLLSQSPPLRNHLSPVDENFLVLNRSTNYKFLPKNTALVTTLQPIHYTPEVLDRLTEVENLHHSMNHPGDTTLGEALDSGAIKTPLNCTSIDVHLNRQARLDCPQCSQGKDTAASYPESTTQPSTTIDTLVIDVSMLPCASIAGNTAELSIIEEVSGTFAYTACKSKTVTNVTAAIINYIDTQYTPYGHIIKYISADAESIFSSPELVQALGLRNISITYYDATMHAKRVERHTRTHHNRLTATLAGIPFYLPKKLTLLVHKSIAFSMTLTPNSRSSPNTPYTLRTGRRYIYNPQFLSTRLGTTAMIPMGNAKQSQLAREIDCPRNQVPHTELAICVGFSDKQSCYDWVTASGRVLPRKHFTIVNTIPFGCKPRTVVHSILPKQPIYVSNPNPATTTSVEPIPNEEDTSTPNLPVFPTTTTEQHETVTPFTDHSETLDDQSDDFDDDTVITKIISHTGHQSKINSLEFLVEWEDGDRSHMWYKDIKHLDIFQLYVAANPTLSKLSTSKTIKSTPSKNPFDELEVDDSTTTDVEYSLPPVPITKRRSTRLSLAAVNHLIGTALRKDLKSRPIPVKSSPLTFTQIPPAAEEGEITIAEAMLIDPIATKIAVDIEMLKQSKTYATLVPCTYSSIPDNAITSQALMWLKPKWKGNGDFDKFSARMAFNGKSQPPDSYVDISAATAADEMKMTMLAAYHARAVKEKRVKDLHVSDFDVPGAFLQNKFTSENCPRPLYMKIPKNIPHPMAGQWCHVVGALYGTKQANHIFDEDFRKTMELAQFYPTEIEPSIYHRENPTDSSYACSIAMHVDDGTACYTYKPYYDEVIAVLTTRYGPLTHHEECTSTTGYNIQRFPDGSCHVNQRGFLDRMMSLFDADSLTPVLTPSLPDLFSAPTDTTPVNTNRYQSLTGNLTFLLKSRDDIRKEVNHMSTRNNSPVQSDVTKLGRILSYINGTRDISRRYFSDDPTLYITVDASYGVHTKGNSHSGFFVSVGRNSAPVLCCSSKQKECVATGSMEAEYVALSQAVKKALPLRFLLEQLGFPQPGPMIVFEDNMSAINLAIAPTVTKNSKHIFQRHHFIRTMVKQKIVTIQHLPTAEMTADLLTKAMPPKLFLRLRDKLMNSPSVTQATPTATLAGGCQLDTTISSILPIGMLGAISPNIAWGISPTQRLRNACPPKRAFEYGALLPHIAS